MNRWLALDLLSILVMVAGAVRLATSHETAEAGLGLGMVLAGLAAFLISLLKSPKDKEIY